MTYLPLDVQKEMIKLRGRILLQVRESPMKLLYIFLSDEKNTFIRLQKGKIIIAFKSEPNYKFCNKPDVILGLKNIISRELDEDIDVEMLYFNDDTPDALSTADIVKLFSGAESINIKRR